MKRLLLIAALIGIAGTAAYTALERAKMKHPASGKEINIPGRDGNAMVLFNGWRLTPAGRQIPTGDMTLSAALSPDGKILAATNSGYTEHFLRLVDIATEKQIAQFPLDRSWSGLAWTPDGKRILLSGGVGNYHGDLLVFQNFDGTGWAPAGGVSLYGAVKDKTSVASIQITPDGKVVFAVNTSDDYVYAMDSRTGRGLGRVKLGANPMASALSKDGKTLYVASIGAAELSIIDASDPSKLAVTDKLATEQHPNSIVLTGDGRLFVSCGDANAVVSFDLATKKRLEVISTALSPKAPAGSTPNHVSVSADNTRLYVANADNNDIAVVNIAEKGDAKVLGFIPTGWYPTFSMPLPDGKRLLIATGKGMGTGPNQVQRPIPTENTGNFRHMGHNLSGFLAFVDLPDPKKLASYSKQVYENTPYRDTLLAEAKGSGNTIIPTKVGEGSPIKHILYIIKENRTYDQVLSDLAQGNGDKSLLLFGRDVTPNHHALAEEFVLLDNLYCSGEVSQDGHPWSTSAYVTDFTTRSWLLGYSRHGRPIGTRGAVEQSSPYIWEAAEKKGLSIRGYGYGGRRGLGPEKLSQEFDRRVAPDQASRTRDFNRADNFIAEFLQMEKENRVPNFMVMSLGENHTQGTLPGAYTPKAQVASNDQAIGKIAEAISKSSLWSKFAIFIIEDDAQNGADHIDSHRTVGLVISPYTKRKHVDSTMYSTASMLRTMELLLGLPPLTQYDAAATVMFESFTNKADLTPYTLKAPQIDLMSKNPAHAYGAAESAAMNWDKYDDVDEQALNRILWHSIRGAHVPVPAPVRRALPTPNGFLLFREGAGE